MTASNVPAPAGGRVRDDLRVAITIAALMLAIPLSVKLATRAGWMRSGDFSDRSLMILLAAFIVLTGNSIPKRIPLRVTRGANAQAFYRFAGWTWVLAGLAFGLAWVLLPVPMATAATFVLMPLAIVLVAVRASLLASSGAGKDA